MEVAARFTAAQHAEVAHVHAAFCTQSGVTYPLAQWVAVCLQFYASLYPEAAPEHDAAAFVHWLKATYTPNLVARTLH